MSLIDRYDAVVAGAPDAREDFTKYWFSVCWSERVCEFHSLLEARTPTPPIAMWLATCFGVMTQDISIVWRVWAGKKQLTAAREQARLTTLLAWVDWSSMYDLQPRDNQIKLDFPSHSGAALDALVVYAYRDAGTGLASNVAISCVVVGATRCVVAVIRPPQEMIDQQLFYPAKYGNFTLPVETDARDVIEARVREWCRSGEKVYLCGDNVDGSVPWVEPGRQHHPKTMRKFNYLGRNDDPVEWWRVTERFLRITNTQLKLEIETIEYLHAHGGLLLDEVLSHPAISYDIFDLASHYPNITLLYHNIIPVLRLKNSTPLAEVVTLIAFSTRITTSCLDLDHALVASEAGSMWQMPVRYWATKHTAAVVSRTMARRIALLCTIADGLMRPKRHDSSFWRIVTRLPSDLLVIIALRWLAIQQRDAEKTGPYLQVADYSVHTWFEALTWEGIDAEAVTWAL